MNAGRKRGSIADPFPRITRVEGKGWTQWCLLKLGRWDADHFDLADITDSSFFWIVTQVIAANLSLATVSLLWVERGPVVRPSLLDWPLLDWLFQVKNEPQLRPPTLAVLAALASGLVSLASLYLLLRCVFHFTVFKDKQDAKNQFKKVLGIDPSYKQSLEAGLEQILKGEIPPKSKLYEYWVAENVFELPRYIIQLVESQWERLLKNIAMIILAVIVVFASLYMADFTLEWGIWGRAGFQKQFETTGTGQILHWLLEGIYFSTVVFTTLGLGDIAPLQSPVARLLVVLELLTFLAVFSIQITSVINAVQGRVSFLQDLDLLKLRFEEYVQSVLEVGYSSPQPAVALVGKVEPEDTTDPAQG